jgi:hypothetical protein
LPSAPKTPPGQISASLSGCGLLNVAVTRLDMS